MARSHSTNRTHRRKVAKRGNAGVKEHNKREQRRARDRKRAQAKARHNAYLLAKYEGGQ